MKTFKKLQARYLTFFILPVFAFLLGCMLMINVVPLNRTCKLEDSDREYNIMKNSKLRTPKLIILILSSPKNLDNRTTIRKTWVNLQTRTTTVVRHYFVTGSLGLTTDDILHLSSEQSQFNDLLILPMHDSYSNLTQKVLNSFKWLSDQLDVGLNFKYVLKCDDDSFVWINNLIDEIQLFESTYLDSNMNIDKINKINSPFIQVNAQVNDESVPTTSLQLYWGYFNGNAQVQNSGKWKENSWILCDHYLPYAVGGGYILSKGLIVHLANNAKHLRYYKSEDASVGAWLSSINNVLRIHDCRFDTEWTSRGCWNSYLVSHHLTKQQIYSYYDNIVKNGKMCDVETITRNHYSYNWNVSPSKCCNKKLN